MGYRKFDTKKCLLIVEDEIETRTMFRKEAEEYENLELSGETGSEYEAMNIMKSKSIDILILDLELEEGSGIGFLECLKEEKIRLPFTIVITNVRSKIIHQLLREYGIDFIYLKNNPKYGAKTVLDIAFSCSRYQKQKKNFYEEAANRGELMVEETSDEGFSQRDLLLWDYIQDELRGMGFSVKGIGTTYLNEAIFHIVKMGRSGRRMSLTKEIYPMLAEKYTSTYATVERNIRTSIENAWTKGTTEELVKHYPFEYSSKVGRPTNMEFMYNISGLIAKRI